ncbi:glutathione S-transferase [Phascolomyces articulosus]|uniref:Glutathione S-transferase n=1 Tax=Phascolomyces articulosus TaxID=60185 RepID=A0AAD5JYG8_9FUNG|nr:glutathione S-transferase [Phascolomyces articulosus]
MTIDSSSTVEKKKLIVYNSPMSPAGHLVLMALKLTGANHEMVSVDLKNKDWYKEIYPEAKVPGVKCGDEFIAESLVIVELLHDLYPEAKLYPIDPVKKAKMKFIIRLYNDKSEAAFHQFLFNQPATKESFTSFVESISGLYRRLNGFLLEASSSGPFYSGTEFSAFEIAVAPFLNQFRFFSRFLTGQDFKVLDELPRLKQFTEAVLSDQTFKETLFMDEKASAAFATEKFKMTRNMFVE